MYQKDCFNISIRLTDSQTICKNNVECVDESYSLSIKRAGQNKTHIWILTIERYEKFKVIILSFYLKRHRNSKGSKKFNRNKGADCIDPIVVLQLFRECIKLCRNKKNESYAFGFYALDDEYVGEEEMREDMNRRMSVFTKFLERHEDLKNHVLINTGNIQDSIYLGYDPSISNKEIMDEFIAYYTPILREEIRKLFAKDQDSQKL